VLRYVNFKVIMSAKILAGKTTAWYRWYQMVPPHHIEELFIVMVCHCADSRHVTFSTFSSVSH